MFEDVIEVRFFSSFENFDRFWKGAFLILSCIYVYTSDFTNVYKGLSENENLDEEAISIPFPIIIFASQSKFTMD